MKSWLHLRVIILCTALFTGYAPPAQAQDDTPSQIRGNWALPDCGRYDEALIITRHFYLRSNKDGSAFWPLGAVQTQKDYWVMPVEGEKRPVQVTADSVLRVGLPAHAPQKWPKKWDNLSMDSRREYTGCTTEIPAVLPDPLVRVMQHIDEIRDTCHVSSPACGQLLFDIADENRNKKISAREMKTAAQMLADMALLAENKSASRDALDKAVYQSMREADRIASLLMPGGKELRYEDFSGFLEKANSPALRDALAKLGALAPGLSGR